MSVAQGTAATTTSTPCQDALGDLSEPYDPLAGDALGCRATGMAAHTEHLSEPKQNTQRLVQRVRDHPARIDEEP